MPYEVTNWDFRRPVSKVRPDVAGSRKYSSANLEGLTRSFYDDTRGRDQNRRYRILQNLQFDVPSGGRACMLPANGNVFPVQYYPSTAMDIRVESNLRRQGTSESLSEEGFFGPKGRNTKCPGPAIDGPLLSDWSMNEGRSGLSEDYNRRMDKFRASDDVTPFIHSYPFRQSIFEAIADPGRTGAVSQNEIRALYPVLFNPGQSATQSAYAVTY